MTRPAASQPLRGINRETGESLGGIRRVRRGRMDRRTAMVHRQGGARAAASQPLRGINRETYVMVPMRAGVWR